MLRLKFASNIWNYRQLCGTFECQKFTAQPTHIFQQRSAGLRTGCSYIMRTKSHHLSYILRKYPGRSDNTSSKTNITSTFGIDLSVRTTSGQGTCPPPKPEKKYANVLLYGLIAVLTTALGATLHFINPSSESTPTDIMLIKQWRNIAACRRCKKKVQKKEISLQIL